MIHEILVDWDKFCQPEPVLGTGDLIFRGSTPPQASCTCGSSGPRLGDVEDVAQLREVGRHELAAAQGEELVVLLEGVHEAQGGEEGAQLRHHPRLHPKACQDVPINNIEVKLHTRRRYLRIKGLGTSRVNEV